VVAGFEVEDTLYVMGPVVWFGFLKYFIVAAGIGAPLFLGYVIVNGLWTRRNGRVRSGAQNQGGDA